jgi:hypothetical protein
MWHVLDVWAFITFLMRFWNVTVLTCYSVTRKTSHNTRGDNSCKTVLPGSPQLLPHPADQDHAGESGVTPAKGHESYVCLGD